MFVVCPGLEHTVSGSVDTDFDDHTDGVTSIGDSDKTDLTVYGGFETEYDFRGTQTLWAKPILYFPETGTVTPDTGKRYTRRHYGRATDATHERANDRVPINEWWMAIYDDIADRLVGVDHAIRRTRAIAYDFETHPFDAATCYGYWGIAEKYATVGADCATSLASHPDRPTAFNLQLSLLIAVLEEYDGLGLRHLAGVLEVAGERLQIPVMMIQLAMREHDRQTTEAAKCVLDERQQRLSDDIIDSPGIEVDTEAVFSGLEAQRIQDYVQEQLDNL